MKFVATPIPGLMEVEAVPHLDDRGAFARVYCKDFFAEQGIDFIPCQANLSTNTRAGTLRGLHFQTADHAEEKFIRAVTGSAWDVAVDLRPGATFGLWHAVELSAARMNAVFIPKGFAHGFLTLHDDTTLLYLMGSAYVAGQAAGIRWNDPDIGIAWPAKPVVLSAKDAALPGLREQRFG